MDHIKICRNPSYICMMDGLSSKKKKKYDEWTDPKNSSNIYIRRM